MSVPIYTPHEMVRLEILAYKNPGGLHPIEENWRDLCRKLMQHCEELQISVELAKKNQYKFKSEFEAWKPFKFPQPFSETPPADG